LAIAPKCLAIGILTPFTIISPVSGTTWEAGSKQTITWGYTGNPGSKVRLDLLQSGSYLLTIASSVSVGTSGAGSYAWNIPGALDSGSDYTIGITSTTDSSATGTSESFTINGPTITNVNINSSNGTFTAGQKYTISWSYTGSPGNVKIDLLQNGSEYANIKSSTNVGKSNAGSYSWTIPATQPTGSYTVKVTALANSDCTNTSSSFSIAGPTITGVNINSSGGTCTAGQKYTISWSYTGSPGNVKIVLQGSTTTTTIKSSTSAGTSGTGSYAWTIPNAQSTGSYTVTVTALANADFSNTSSSFSIAGPTISKVSVSSTNGTLTAGQKYTISWSYTGNPGNVKIVLLQGSTTSTIKSSTSVGQNNTGSYNWTVPNTQSTGSNYQVTVTALANSSCSATSSSFAISGPTITVTSPNGGETWTAGQKYTIKWTYTGNPGHLSIELLNGTAVPQTIKSSASAGANGSGAYNWTIPKNQAAGSSYRIQVTSTANGSITDTSDNDFSIVAVKASAGPDQQAKGSVLVNLNGLNSTAAGDASYHWTQTAGPLVAISDPDAAETNFAAPGSSAGGESLSFQLTVSDKDGTQSRDSCIVNVSDINVSPTADAGPNRTVSPAEIVELDGSHSSSVDSIVSYNWRQVSGTPVVLSDASSVQPTFVAPGATSARESLLFELAVTDQAGLRSRDTCIIDISAGYQPPVANAGTARTVASGSIVVLDGSGSTDPEGGITSYNWKQTAGIPVTLSNPTSVDPIFTAPLIDDAGEDLVFELTVTDAAGLADKSKVVISVEGESVQ
jgi:hypothetical protein